MSKEPHNPYDEPEDMASLENLLHAVMEIEALEDWAKGKVIVGDPNSSYRCPLATYLKEKTGIEWTVADGYACVTHGPMRGRAGVKLPDWADLSADLVDGLLGDHVTREQFKQILLQAREKEQQ